MLMKLTPGVNVNNVLKAAFTRPDPKSAKKTVKLSVFFSLLGSANAKAARRLWMKLTNIVDFTNMFTKSFYVCSQVVSFFLCFLDLLS